MITYTMKTVAVFIYLFALAPHIVGKVVQVTYSHYQPCKLEKQWDENVHEWQNDPCKFFPYQSGLEFLKAVETINAYTQAEVFDYVIQGHSRFDKYISHHHYNVTMDTGKSINVAIPIEGVIGLARDPRDCNHKNLEYTQSKAFLVPMRGSIEQIMAFDPLTAPTKKNVTFSGGYRKSLVPKGEYEPKYFLFDAGATHYLDHEIGQGTKWIVDFYSSVGIDITNIVAWEKDDIIGRKAIEGIPDRLVHGYQFFNHAMESGVDSVWNPLNFIKGKCDERDFVVFKLDIDHNPTEAAIVYQLLHDAEARNLIDDFYYEDHFKNPAMKRHGWDIFYSTLEDYYRNVTLARGKGFRMHYWP